VRITRAILRLRASTELACVGVVGVGGTSKEGERVKRGVACTRELGDDRGTVSRKMRGRGVPSGRRDLLVTTNGTSDSTEESDVLSSDSLEDEAAWENGAGKLSVLPRGSSMTGRR
jgi:hypothetical protein